MRRARAAFRTLCVCLLAASAVPREDARLLAKQSAALKIVVIAGEDAVNIIQQKSAVTPVVEVRDRNDLPVAGALVTFTIGGGKSATFAGGLRTLTVTTNAAGRAAAAGFAPSAAGAVQINVTATFQGQTALAAITQTNYLTASQAAAASSGGSGGATTGTAAAAGGSAGGVSGGLMAGVVAAVAGGAAAAVVATKQSEGTESSTPVPPTPPPPTISISPTGAGIQDVTVFTFTANGGVAGSTHLWDFGDGARAEGQSVTHVYAAEGSFRVSLTSGDKSTSATTSVRSLTGRWIAELPASGLTFTLVLTQQGARLSGQWFVEHAPGNCCGGPAANNVSPVSGSVNSPRSVSLTQEGECLRSHTGTFNDDVTYLTSQGTFGRPSCGTQSGPYTFRRQ